MSERQADYIPCFNQRSVSDEEWRGILAARSALYSSASVPGLKVTYTDDEPDIRDWLINLRRDLLRKVKQIDELINTLPT